MSDSTPGVGWRLYAHTALVAIVVVLLALAASVLDDGGWVFYVSMGVALLLTLVARRIGDGGEVRR